MLYKEKNDKGKIKYDENIIGSIAKRVIEATEGRALPSDAKGRLVKGGPGPGSNDVQIIDMQFSDGTSSDTSDGKSDGASGKKLNVKMYIIMRFGSSMSKVCNDIDRSFRKAVLAVMGTEVGDFSIIVKGFLSKNISKRNIEVTTHAGDQPSD